MATPVSDIRGFNYSGSWGTSGLDLWQHHDHGTMAVEVARGKKYFPGWNAARWWLSHESFLRNPERFLANLDAGIGIFASHGIAVMPVLFNRWRASVCDFGGVWLEHIVPGASFFSQEGDFGEVGRDDLNVESVEHLFGEYLAAVIDAHGADERVFAWDLCNEPFSAPYVVDPDSPLRAAELRWLRWCAEFCRVKGASQPLTIGNLPQLDAVRITEPLVDFISFHPYYIPSAELPSFLPEVGSKEGYEQLLDEVVEIAAESGKGLLASETVWGALDDADRTELIRYTLGQLGEREIGFIVHALHHSLIADLHAPEYGPVGPPGRLEFIEANGSLRAGHEAFNEF